MTPSSWRVFFLGSDSISHLRLGLITSLLHGPEDEKFSLKGALTRVEARDLAMVFVFCFLVVGGLLPKAPTN